MERLPGQPPPPQADQVTQPGHQFQTQIPEYVYGSHAGYRDPAAGIETLQLKTTRAGAKSPQAATGVSSHPHSTAN